MTETHLQKIENNGTNNVTVTATQPTKVTMKWTDNGAEKSKILKYNQ